MNAAMTPNGQSRSQKTRPHRHGTTTTRIGNQPFNCFDVLGAFMLAAWPDYVPNSPSQALPHLKARNIPIGGRSWGPAYSPPSSPLGPWVQRRYRLIRGSLPKPVAL